MFKNYLKIAIRNIWTSKGYTFINVFGLAVGIACCILISIYVIHELSYDDFHKDSENLYRVYVIGEINGQDVNYAVSMKPLGPAAKEKFPEVLNSVRIRPSQDRTILSFENMQFFEENVYFAGEEFFNIFSHNVLMGDVNSMLVAPNTIVLTDKLAKKYFGENDPIGKILTFNGQDDYTVTGIVDNPPTNSHLEFDALCSLSSLPTEEFSEWTSIGIYTYVKLENNSNIDELNEKLSLLVQEKTGLNLEEHGIELLLRLQPVKDIHLYSDLDYDIGSKSSIFYIYTFTAIALFLLLIACINFMNLTTSRSMNRALEIGMRKVMGADRGKVMIQFLGESLILTLIASFIALGLIELFLPVFNSILGKELSLEFVNNANYGIIVFLFILLTGVFAGSYPAFYLSSFDPIPIMKGTLNQGKSKSGIRNALVLLQFFISITLIASTAVIYQQLQYFQNKNLGFDKEHMLILPLNNEEVVESSAAIMQVIEKIPGVLSVSNSSNYPSAGSSEGFGMFPEGYSQEKPWLFKTMRIDNKFLDTYKMKITDGRNFEKERSTDSQAVIINETDRRDLGWDESIGKTLNRPSHGSDENVAYTVIGVVDDFHVNSLRDAIEPFAIFLLDEGEQFLSIRLESGGVYATIDRIKDKWSDLAPALPFDYHFLDDRFDQIHQNDQNLGKIFIYFTSLAIIIACLGLFGLASFSTERRIKEIGIRKTLGASVGHIVGLLSMEFTRWVILANVAAWPVAWFIMNKWLQNFAYRIEMSIWVFLFAGVLALIISMITVSYQSIKAAIANPIRSLRYE